MERREYRISVGNAIFFGVGGAACLALALPLIIVAFIIDHQGVGLVGVLVLPFGLWFGSGALRRPVLAFDDTGLYLRGIFKTRHIPWDAVQAFRAAKVPKGGGRINAHLRTGKVILLPDLSESLSKCKQRAAELTEALHEHGGPAVPSGDDAHATGGPVVSS